MVDPLDGRVADDLDIHIIMDNDATHKTLRIKAWLARRPPEMMFEPGTDYQDRMDQRDTTLLTAQG